MKKKVTIFFRVLFTLSLCGYVLYKAGVFHDSGRKELLVLVSEIDYLWVLLSLAVTVVLNVLSAFKWKMLLHSRRSFVGLWRLYIFYNIGKFFNLILPTSMGGDVVRIYLLGEYTQQKFQAAASVIIERFTGLIIMLLFAVLVTIFNLDKFNQEWLFSALFFCVVLVVVGIWCGVKVGKIQSLARFISTRSGFLLKIFKKIGRIRTSILEYSDDPKALIIALINSVIFQIGAVVNVWASARVFSDNISFIVCLLAVPVIMFIMNLPFSIGGIGLMEFGYLFVLSLFGVSPALAVSTAMFIRLKIILDAFVGGVFYVVGHKGESLTKNIKVVQEGS